MFRAIVIGLAWGLGFRLYLSLALVLGCPVYVVNLISLAAFGIGTFLWYIMPPLRSNDELIKEDRG